MYYYVDPSREHETWSLPDVEVFYSPYWITGDRDGNFDGIESTIVFDHPGENAVIVESGGGWFYAYGFPGCLWDSEPFGPYSSEEAALEAARSE